MKVQLQVNESRGIVDNFDLGDLGGRQEYGARTTERFNVLGGATKAAPVCRGTRTLAAKVGQG
jgi:hypothetical protein